jgi:hypothetical protein
MKKGMEGSMNIDFTEYYDADNDIYYVSFKIGEPSYVVEVDDILLLEVGIFTSLPTGFRIMNFKKHKINEVFIHVKEILKQQVLSIEKDRSHQVKHRSDQIKTALEKVFA